MTIKHEDKNEIIKSISQQLGLYKRNAHYVKAEIDEKVAILCFALDN